MQTPRLALLIAGILSAPLVAAGPPALHTQGCSVSVDGNRLDTVLTPNGADQRNTFAYEALTRRWHFWGFLADDANFPSVASSLRAVVHATSSDGVHFTSDGALSYAFGSSSYTSYGASIDPPLDFFRAVRDAQTGTWKLFNWTENVGASVGAYDYNSSVNDLGTVAGTTAVVHQGPLDAPGVAGNHVGTFGLVDGNLFLRLDGGAADGGNAQYPYDDGAAPWTGAGQPSLGARISEADLFVGTPYCWFLDPSCGSADARTPAYVHNVGRTLRQPDGSLGTYYTFRDANTYARLDQQVWYVESTDDGSTWSTPAGAFADGSALTIDGTPLDAAPGAGRFSDVDMVLDGSRYQLYLSAQDADGNYVMVTTQGRPGDAIFFNGFDGCD